MKIDPVSILLNENFRIDKKIYFISGNEKTLMQKIKATIVGKYQKNTNAKHPYNTIYIILIFCLNFIKKAIDIIKNNTYKVNIIIFINFVETDLSSLLCSEAVILF